MSYSDSLLIALAVCVLLFVCVLVLSFTLMSTSTYLKRTQEDYAHREAAWRVQQNPDLRSQSDIQRVNGMFDEKRVREIMRERDDYVIHNPSENV